MPQLPLTVTLFNYRFTSVHFHTWLPVFICFFFFFFFIADCDTASLIRSVCSQRLCFKQIRISFIVSRCFFLKWYSCGHDILVIKSDLMHENQTLQMQKGDQFKCEHYNIECRFSSWDHCMQLGGIQEFFSHYSLDQSGGHTD